MTDLIQTIAAAIEQANSGDVGLETSDDFARAALTAINEAGLVIVPREPTEAMVKASGMVEDEYYFATQESADNHARQVYSDMIAAITTGETGNG